MSLVYRLYKIGEILEPCGEPARIRCLRERHEPTRTMKALCERNDVIILMRCRGKLSLMSLYMIPVVQVESKALFTSSRIPIVVSLLLSPTAIKSQTRNN